MIDDILEFNKKFVESKGYEKYITNKYPDKKIAILSCMDTRLTELLPAALGIRNGDVKIIKNAGGVISHPFGSVIRSLMVAIYELGVKEVMVVAHSDCGACHMNSNEMIEHMKARGIKQETIDMIRFCGVDFGAWLGSNGECFYCLIRILRIGIKQSGTFCTKTRWVGCIFLIGSGNDDIIFQQCGGSNSKM